MTKRNSLYNRIEKIRNQSILQIKKHVKNNPDILYYNLNERITIDGNFLILSMNSKAKVLVMDLDDDKTHYVSLFDFEINDIAYIHDKIFEL